MKYELKTVTAKDAKKNTETKSYNAFGQSVSNDSDTVYAEYKAIDLKRVQKNSLYLHQMALCLTPEAQIVTGLIKFVKN